MEKKSVNRQGGGKKKPRITILMRIGLLFFIAFLFSLLIAVTISRRRILSLAATQGQSTVHLAAASVTRFVDDPAKIERLRTDEKYLEQVHRIFRYICRHSGLSYLYMYTVEDENSRNYVVAAASSDEDEALLQKRLPSGTVQKTEKLLDAEMVALSGDHYGGFEFVNGAYGRLCIYFIPVFDKEGNVLGIIGADYSLDSIEKVAMNDLRFALILGLLLLGSTCIIAVILIKRLVIRPIRMLSDDMQHFAEDKMNHVRPETKIRTTLYEDEITDIEKSFVKMSLDISNYVEDIKNLTGERIQARTQIEIAQKIQAGIVPREKSLSGEGYEIYACMSPAKAVAGDFYECISLDEDRVCMVVGDISGKGISAALFMTMVKTIIRGYLKAGFDIAEALNRTNSDLYSSNPEGMFATVFAAVLNTATGELTFANAGHNPPLLLGSGLSYISMDKGIALGLFDEADIIAEEIRLKDGEGLFIYTDGITEAINTQKKLFGEERLKETVSGVYERKGTSTTALELVKTVRKTVEDYFEGMGQFDDITCAAILYHENSDRHLELSVDIASFAVVKNVIMSFFGDSEKTRNIILACEEMFVNIVNYSKADRVSFSCEINRNLFSVVFMDNGICFDPTARRNEDREFEDLDRGGMGIMLAKSYSSRMTYCRVGNKNFLTMHFGI